MDQLGLTSDGLWSIVAMAIKDRFGRGGTTERSTASEEGIWCSSRLGSRSGDLFILFQLVRVQRYLHCVETTYPMMLCRRATVSMWLMFGKQP